MARIRSIHPGLATDEAFATMSMAARVAWVLLWTECDDTGVFEWKPLVLKMRIFPADNVDFPKVLDELLEQGLVRRFEHGGKPYGAVKNFCKFQRPKKPKSVYFVPDDIGEFVNITSRDEDPETALRRRKCEEQGNACAYCGTGITYYAKRSNSLELDHDIPRSRGGSDAESNLVATCRACNRSKRTMTGDEFRMSLSCPKCPDNDAKSEFAFQMEDGGGRKKEEEKKEPLPEAQRPVPSHVHAREAPPQPDLGELEAALRCAAGLENDTSPSLMVLSPILGLLSAGFSLNEDILPSIRARSASVTGRRAGSWSYFVNPIREDRQRRLDAEAAGATPIQASARASPKVDLMEAARIGSARAQKRLEAGK